MIEKDPIKCLGKWFDDSLIDRNNIASMEKLMEERLKSIEKSGLLEKFKVMPAMPLSFSLTAMKGAVN